MHPFSRSTDQTSQTLQPRQRAGDNAPEDFAGYSLERMRPLTTAVMGLGVVEYGLFLFACARLPGPLAPSLDMLPQALVLTMLVVLSVLMFRIRSATGYGLTGGAFVLGIVANFLLTSLGMPNAVSWVLPAVMIVPIAAGPLWLNRFQFIVGTLSCWAVALSLFSLMPMSAQEGVMLRLYLVMNLFLATVLHLIFDSFRMQNFRLLTSLRIQASQDGLTGLLNRRSFLERSDRFLRAGTGVGAGADNGSPVIAALYIDLDHFKSINDRFGHSAGDQALRRVAALLSAAAAGHGLGQGDQHDNGGLAGRLGGEEFAILCAHPSSSAALAHAQALREAVAGLESAGMPLTVSIGLAQQFPGETIEKLLQRADAAMLQAKRNGRNAVEAAMLAA